MDYEKKPAMDSCCMGRVENIPGQMCEPVYECPEERVCHRYICYEVPQEW